ncbi:hypothetical protein HHK36_004317 [Tetracentron sinense]|uniref:J domain-containing protein n=1 Tax=Tetracentron sinense TaxID=13715 RepID=A0A834ZQF2_TETSI|nr:hypothetical protein HHK36_004317 [Tetracentron sinense]
MGGHQHSKSPSFHNIFGTTKGATSIRDIFKAYKSLVMKWHPDKNLASNKSKTEAKFKVINGVYEAFKDEKQEGGNIHGVRGCGDGGGRPGEDDPTTHRGFHKHRRSFDNFFSSCPSPLARSATWNRRSRRSHTTMSTPSSLSENMSQRSTNPIAFPNSLSRSRSQRSTTPIMFSHSISQRKPPPIEKQLECTLEELCHGCVKKIKITRDVVTDTGIIVQEEELLRIKVKPGWKKGTKITFEGMGDERPGILPADIIFLITEKRHPLFKKEGDDLVLAIEIPLVKALTGCNLSIPLLDREKMRLSFDHIIYPGYEKIISGKGMPNTRQQGRKGDLRIKFHINFPTQLSHEQRSDILRLLQDSS